MPYWLEVDFWLNAPLALVKIPFQPEANVIVDVRLVRSRCRGLPVQHNGA